MKLIVATDETGGIAKDGIIPWSCPEDMDFFKTMTIGNQVIMGGNTFNTFKKPLPFRKNYILTKNDELIYSGIVNTKGVVEFASFERLFRSGEFSCSWVIGGGQVYAAALPYATEIYMSVIKGDYKCDLFFPKIPPTFVELAQIKLSENCTVHKYINWTYLSDYHKLKLIEKIEISLNIQPLKSGVL